jgi:hypothetical protein
MKMFTFATRLDFIFVAKLMFIFLIRKQYGQKKGKCDWFVLRGAWAHREGQVYAVAAGVDLREPEHGVKATSRRRLEASGAEGHLGWD